MKPVNSTCGICRAFIVTIFLYGSHIFNNILIKMYVSKVIDFTIKYKSCNEPLT